MSTSEVIDRLVADLRPVDFRAPARRVVAGLIGGVALSAAAMWLWIGPRPDLAAALMTPSFWVKFFYTMGLAASGGWALARMSRPDGTAMRAALVGVAVLVALAAAAAGQLVGAPAPARWPMILGSSANVCPWRIVALSMPIFAGAVWAVRGLAPTRPMQTGAALGLAAGAAGAWVYAFSCGETAAPFVALWYTLGVAAVGIIGAAAGQVLLRW